jgi:hypothetical protein
MASSRDNALDTPTADSLVRLLLRHDSDTFGV